MKRAPCITSCTKTTKMINPAQIRGHGSGATASSRNAKFSVNMAASK